MANVLTTFEMLQDGQGTQAPSKNTLNLLQIVLLAHDTDGERDATKDRYAVIRFPHSYKDAILAIERSLGEYLPNGKADSIDIFCQMLNGSDEWIWAKADREDWNLIREQLLLSRRALGIRRPNNVPHDITTKPVFIKGPITITYGERNLVNTKWASVSPSGSNQMDRPESYQEAKDLIVAAVKANSYVWPPNCRPLTSRPLSNFEFKFYYFTSDQSKGPNTDLWVNFPANAYKDDEIWRAVVPEPRKILGFTLEQK